MLPDRVRVQHMLDTTRLSHGYLDVDLDAVWEILTSDLPAVEPELVAPAKRLD